MTLELFNAISEEASDQVAFSSISKLLSDSQRLNTVNDMGDLTFRSKKMINFK
ncbi:MAG: hypothetical protein NTZ86_03180 [Legionellales bacterium]|nr:hypothetical protein [Legionellales bacterium]